MTVMMTMLMSMMLMSMLVTMVRSMLVLLVFDAIVSLSGPMRTGGGLVGHAPTIADLGLYLSYVVTMLRRFCVLVYRVRR